MASKPKHKMSIEERAKQFMPFSALKGLNEALAEKEKIIVPKIELSEDGAVELDRKMHTLKCGKIATIVYYDNENYLRITGMVAKIDEDSRILQIVNTKISFDDIYNIILSP